MWTARSVYVDKHSPDRKVYMNLSIRWSIVIDDAQPKATSNLADPNFGGDRGGGPVAGLQTSSLRASIRNCLRLVAEAQACSRCCCYIDVGILPSLLSSSLSPVYLECRTRSLRVRLPPRLQHSAPGLLAQCLAAMFVPSPGVHQCLVSRG